MTGEEERSIPEGSDQPEQPDLQLEYPCEWGYRLIGPDGEEIKRMLAAVLGDRPHTLTEGQSSSSGKYVSLNLQLEVASEEDRKGLYKTMSLSPAVKVIL